MNSLPNPQRRALAKAADRDDGSIRRSDGVSRATMIALVRSGYATAIYGNRDSSGSGMRGGSLSVTLEGIRITDSGREALQRGTQ